MFLSNNDDNLEICLFCLYGIFKKKTYGHFKAFCMIKMATRNRFVPATDGLETTKITSNNFYIV